MTSVSEVEKKVWPRPASLLPQLDVVVDAAVEGDRQAECGVHQRLRPADGQVDDRQAPMAEAGGAPYPQPGPVGSPAGHDLTTPLQGLGFWRSPVEAELTAESAHRGPLPPPRRGRRGSRCPWPRRHGRS